MIRESRHPIQGRKKALIFRLSVLLTLIAALLFAQAAWGIFGYLKPGKIEKVLDAAGILAPMLHIVLMAAAIIVSPIPSVPLAVTGGMFFGPFLGSLYSLAGALIGAVVSFLIARHLGIEVIERIIGRQLNFYPRGSENLIMRIVLFSRLIPVISFDVVSYGAGLTKLSIGKFTMATFFGMIPFTIIYSYFGSVLLVRTWVTIVAGGAFIAAFLSFPALVNRYNLFHLKKYFNAGSKPGHGKTGR